MASSLANRIAQITTSHAHFVENLPCPGKPEPGARFRSQGTTPLQRTLLVCIVAGMMLATLQAGCRKQEQAPETETVIREYAELNGLKETHDRELQDELARLQAESATILDLKAKLTPAKESSDLNSVLLEVLPKLEEVDHLKERLAGFGERELSNIDAVQTAELKAILAGYERHRQQLFEALRVANRRCWVDYTMGLAADTDFVDRIEAACLLERMHAAVAIHEAQPERAFASLERMFDYANKLAEVWHIVPRIRAAELRRRAYSTMQQFVLSPSCDATYRVRLRNLTIHELSRWVPESHCWIGDRAVGLHTYEMVRDGQYLSLLSDAEADELSEKKIQFATAKEASDNVDADEAFYLRTMRGLIQATEKPYYQRSEEIAAAEEDLNRMRESETYPMVATQMLLVNEVAVQRQLAEDRAMMEAWAILLSQATGERLPGATHNPCTGNEYRVTSEGGRWILQGLPPLEGLQDPVIPQDG